MSNIKALLVEDDISFAKDIAFLLKDKVYLKHIVSKREALELIRKNKYNLLICDTDLADGPKKNKYGIDVAVKFRKSNPDSKIIGMSADNENKKYWKEHCNCFWNKDINSIYEKNIKKYF